MNSRRFIFLFIFSFSLIFSERSFSQHFLGAISAGINLSQVDGDEVYGFKKVGFNGGPSVIIPFGKDKKWSVTIELLFSQLEAARNQSTEHRTPSGIPHVQVSMTVTVCH